jgi:hypothetical protein
MNRQHLFVLGLLLIPTLAFGQAAGARPGVDPGAAGYIPQGALLFGAIRDGDQQVQAIRGLLERYAIGESLLVRRLTGKPEFMQGRIMLAGLAGSVGMDEWSAIGTVLGRDLAFAVAPAQGRPPQVILASVARDPQALDKLLDVIYATTGLVRDGVPDPNRSHMVEGVRVFKVGPGAFHCRVDQALIFSNSGDLLKRALAQRSKAGAALGHSAKYREALARVPQQARAWASVDVETLRAMIGKGGELPSKLSNPLAGFLFGGWWHTIRHSDQTVVWAEAKDAALQIHASVDGRAAFPATHGGFVADQAAAQTWSAEDLPRFLGAIQVTRNWAGLFAQRESLLNLKASSDVADFSANISNLVGGLDFISDVLAKFEGPAQLIVARQDFSQHSITRSPQLPAFALVLPLDTAKHRALAKRLASGAQSALSFLSIEQSRQGTGGYLIDMDRHRGQRIIFTEFGETEGDSAMNMQPARQGAAKADQGAAPRTAGIRYNFAPAFAVLDDAFVVASSSQLLRDIIDLTVDAPDAAAKGARQASDAVTIDIKALTQVLTDNHQDLVIKRVLDEGIAKAAAEADIDAFLDILQRGERLTLTSRTGDGRRSEAILELTLGEPAAR